MADEPQEPKMTHEEFVLRAIRKLRKPPYKGIHTVYSGFNAAFREYFNEDPVPATKHLAQSGSIVVRPAKGGATLFLPEDAPGGGGAGGADALKKILED